VSELIKIAILGPTGRLGRALCNAVLDHDRFKLVGAVVRSESGLNGQDIGALLNRDRTGCMAEVSVELASENADLVIDASTPEMTVTAAQRLASLAGPALITGVTGFTAEQTQRLEEASTNLPILRAGNFSLGVAVAENLVRQAAALPAREWDIEVSETHHKLKADAPSGTALLLANAAASRRGVSLEEAATWSREGQTGPRETGTIGFSVTRGGSVIGEHSVRFLSELEELTIAHRAFDRSVFAHGALEAALWMHNNGKRRGAGLYSMQNVVAD
jgi:4-hydroxy-tetrahydrodipicolinate reductase